jgi:hypothetical protein
MKKILSILLMGSFLTFTPQALATDGDTAATSNPSSESHKRWKDMTNEEKAAKKAAMKEKLKNMSPEERAKFKEERRAKMKQRYENASPEQKEKMRARIKERRERRQELRNKKHEMPQPQTGTETK